MGTNMENPYAGQGPVLLDIGDDVGALIVVMPPDSDGLEVELRPAGATAADASQLGHHHHDDHDEHDDHDHHSQTHDQAHDHAHGHDHEAAAASDPPAYPHVAVVARPEGSGVVHSLVFPTVTEGEYELYPLPDGPVAMTASVIGGQVTRNRWPG